MASVLRYGSARLFASVSDSPDTLRALTLVNNVKFGFSIERQPVKSIGHSKMLREAVSPPNPNVTFNYYLSDLDNERLFSLPVTSHESYALGMPMFRDLQPFDLAFVANEEQKDFENAEESELSVCLIVNAYLMNYSFHVDKTGIVNISVTFSGDNMMFKTFKNLDEYDFLESDSEDNQMTNQIEFIVNDGTEELTSMSGGGNVVSKIDRFDFSAKINYKKLYDFGQFYHKRKVQHPLITNISVSALVDSFSEGDLKDMLCNDKKNDFIIMHKRRECLSGEENVKAGMLFKGAKLVSQDYSMETSEFLRTNLSFELVTDRDCGVYFTQHVQAGEALTLEDDSLKVDGHPPHVGIEQGGAILVEGILNMRNSLKHFRTDKACSGER